MKPLRDGGRGTTSMTSNYSQWISLVLLTAVPAAAHGQHASGHGSRAPAAHPGQTHSGQTHPGQVSHRGVMTPEQQMEHEFWQQQWMISQMMATQRPAYRPNRQRSGAARARLRAAQPSMGAPANRGFRRANLPRRRPRDRHAPRVGIRGMDRGNRLVRLRRHVLVRV